LVDSALYQIYTRFILKTKFDSIYWIMWDYKSIYFTIYEYLVCDVAFYLDWDGMFVLERYMAYVINLFCKIGVYVHDMVFGHDLHI
jgi:hypothetical protein